MKSISVVGVDGTGKSSTIELLRQAIGEENVLVQYMGARQWETDFANKYHSANQPRSLWYSIMYIVSIIYEMHYRIRKYRGVDKIVIFDRYVYERIVVRQSKGKGILNRIIILIYTIFLKWFFYKPDIEIYLTCPLEVSISRKDDISDSMTIEKLRINKKLLDNFYFTKPNVTIIDTSKLNQAEIVKIIINDMKSSNFDFTKNK